MEAKKKQQSVLNGAMILILAVLLVKIIGVLFKMPLTNMMGAVGRGYFSSAYEIYTPIFAISMSGLPVAVARIIAENVALENYRQARAVFFVAKRLFIIIGVCGTLLMLIVAWPYSHFIADIRNLPATVCIAPSLFFCCYMSAYRGYYEGMRNMTPTAFSQVIEALGKLVAGLLFAKMAITIGMKQFNAAGGGTAIVFGTQVADLTEANSAIAPWAAAGAILGVTFGSAISMLSLMLLYKKKGDGFTRAQLAASSKPDEGLAIVKNILSVGIPMVISSLILNITNLIDTATIQARLATALEKNFDAVVQMHSVSINSAVAMSRLNINDAAEVVKYLWGAYGTALDFKSLIPTITVQLGVSALPALAAAWAVKDKDGSKSTIETVIRVAMLIALPAGIGIAVLSTPILNIIYGRGVSSDAIPIVAPIMACYGLFTFVTAVSTPITNMLQAVGRADIPVKTVIIAAVAKISCNFFLVGSPRFNIYGAVVGTVIFYLIIVGVNLFCLLKISGIRPDWNSVFVKPLICAVFCGFTAYTCYGTLHRIVPGTNSSIICAGTIETLFAIGVAMIVYFASLLLIRGICKEDISVLPKGEKIAAMLEKHGLLG